MRVMAAAAVMAATGAQAEVCVGGSGPPGHVPSPTCVALVLLGQAAEELGLADDGRVMVSEGVYLSADEGRPFARIWVMGRIRPGLAGDLGAAMDHRPEVAAALRLGLQHHYPFAVCSRFDGFMALGGIVEIHMELMSDPVVTPESLVVAGRRTVFEARIDDCGRVARPPAGGPALLSPTAGSRFPWPPERPGRGLALTFGTRIAAPLSSLPLSPGREAEWPTQPASR